VNFTTAMPDANYAISGMTISEANSNTSGNMVSLASDGSGNALLKSASQVRIVVGSTDSNSKADTSDVSVFVVR
jgi:hypothetical protein